MVSRHAHGLEMLNAVDGRAGEEVVERVEALFPDFARQLVESFGDVYGREGLSLRDREIATLGMLAAQGRCWPQFQVHVRAALNVGVSEDEIREIIFQTATYAGFPAALNALFAAAEVFAAQQETHTD